MKKTTRDVDVVKNNMMKFSMIQMNSLLVEDSLCVRVDCSNVIIYAVVVELNRRKQAYVEVSKMFGFLW